MDFASVFDLVSRTFADQLDGYAVFETASGETLRVDLAINEQWFRAIFQDSSGPILVVTPGSITALENGQPVQSESVDTQAALDAWKSQPPITLAPISAGLSQLQATNAQINQIISSLLQVTGGGSLAVAFIPTLCWFNAFYPQVSLGKFVAKDVTGRVCIRDIVFTAQSVSFGIELLAKCNQVTFVFNTGKQEDDNSPYQFIELTSRAADTSEVEFNINFSAFLNLPEQTVEANIVYAQLQGVRGKLQYGKDANDDDPWNIELTESWQLTLKDIFQNYGLQPNANQSTNGSINVNILTARIIKRTLSESGATITLDAPAILMNTSVSLTLNSVTGRDDLIQGFLASCQLTISKGAYLSDTSDSSTLNLTGLEAVLSLGSTTFSRRWIDTQFQIIGGKAEQFETSIGETENDKLTLKEVAFNISAHFQNQQEPVRSMLHAHQLYLSTKQGELSLILKIINDNKPKEPDAKPNEPIKLSLEHPDSDKRAAYVFVQDFINTTGLDAVSTAKRIEVRIRRAKTAQLIRKLQILKWFQLTEDSVIQLRKKDASGKQIVPEAVLNKFKDKLLGEKFENLEDLQKELSTMVSKLELDSFGKKIASSAIFKETSLKALSASLEEFYFQGSLLATTSASELFGEALAASAQFSFNQILGVEIDKLSNLTGIEPAKPGDFYEAQDIQLLLPNGRFSANAAGIVQKFEAVNVNLGSAKIEVQRPGDGKQNLLRLTYLPVKEGLTGQLSIPKAKLKLSATDDLVLTNVKIGLHKESIAQDLPVRLRGFLSQTYIRFGIIVKLPTFNVYRGEEKDFPLNESELEDKIFSLFRLILEKAKIPISDKAFDVVRIAFGNPATRIVGDIASRLNDIIYGITGFGIDDVGLRIKTSDVNAEIKPALSDRTRIAIAVKTKLPELGAYVKYSWREPTWEPPFYKKRTSDPEGKTWPIFPNQELEFIIRFSFKLDVLTRSVEITNVEVFVIPSTNDDIADRLLTGIQSVVFQLMLQYQAIKELVLGEISKRFRIPLPDDWDISLARIEFDSGDKTLSLNIDASENAWNSL
jgi:hypothetical protein